MSDFYLHLIIFVFAWVVLVNIFVVIIAAECRAVSKPLLECDDDSNVAVAGAVLHAMQVMSLMLT